MNYKIELYAEGDMRRGPTRSGVWSASNLHTALARAVTGYPMEKERGVAHVGADWYKLFPGEMVNIEVRRL